MIKKYKDNLKIIVFYYFVNFIFDLDYDGYLLLDKQ